jgi:4-carboxymuconolactone decarboxylase
MTDPDADRLQRGRALARRHLGEDVVERWQAVSPELEELTSGFFGEVWGREEALGRRDRAIVAMTATAALRAGPQLGWHIRGALSAGLSAAEIREVLMAVAGFAGFPAAWQAMEVADGILGPPGP